MARTILTDDMWAQLEEIMRHKGCKRHQNNRNVMEAILWKLRTGSPWRDVPGELCPWITAFNRFNRWAQAGLWDDFFFAYEAKLMKSGYSQTEATSELINMRAELGMDSSEPLVVLAEASPPRFTWSPTRLEIRFVLKSLGVKFTTAKLQTSSSRAPVQMDRASSLIKGMTPKKSEKKSAKKT